MKEWYSVSRTEPNTSEPRGPDGTKRWLESLLWLRAGVTALDLVARAVSHTAENTTASLAPVARLAAWLHHTMTRSER